MILKGSINKVLKDRRKELGKSQDEVAKVLNMSRQAYAKMEAGGGMDVRNLSKVANELQIKVLFIPEELYAAVRGALTDQEASVVVKGESIPETVAREMKEMEGWRKKLLKTQKSKS